MAGKDPTKARSGWLVEHRIDSSEPWYEFAFIPLSAARTKHEAIATAVRYAGADGYETQARRLG